MSVSSQLFLTLAGLRKDKEDENNPALRLLCLGVDDGGAALELMRHWHEISDFSCLISFYGLDTFPPGTTALHRVRDRLLSSDPCIIVQLYALTDEDNMASLLKPMLPMDLIYFSPAWVQHDTTELWVLWNLLQPLVEPHTRIVFDGSLDAAMLTSLRRRHEWQVTGRNPVEVRRRLEN